jgi:hypothetical protein
MVRSYRNTFRIFLVSHDIEVVVRTRTHAPCTPAWIQLKEELRKVCILNILLLVRFSPFGLEIEYHGPNKGEGVNICSRQVPNVPTRCREMCIHRFHVRDPTIVKVCVRARAIMITARMPLLVKTIDNESCLA